MDRIIRSSRPSNAHEARVQKERAIQEQKQDLARHLQEEETMRRANHWYSSTASTSPSSLGKAMSPPFGTLDPSQLEYASASVTRKQPRAPPPPSSSSTTTTRGSESPPVVSARKLAYDIVGLGGVAETLGHPSHALPLSLSEPPQTTAAALKPLVSPTREREEEREHVRQVVAEAIELATREDAERQAKMAEQMRFLLESERQLAERARREREADLAALAQAKRQLEQADARTRAWQDAQREARARTLAAQPRPPEDESPVAEAARRLLRSHANDTDRVLPVLREILSEPEFALPQLWR